MLRVGITGGIGSGKTALTDWLAIKGIVIVDADLAARVVVEPGQPALAEIADKHFGKSRSSLCAGITTDISGAETAMSSCRFPNLYMDIPCGLQVYQRPAMGWPTETCTICNRVYPTRFARRNPPKCVTCRCEFEEKAFADSHCRNCGIVVISFFIAISIILFCLM